MAARAAQLQIDGGAQACPFDRPSPSYGPAGKIAPLQIARTGPVLQTAAGDATPSSRAPRWETRPAPASRWRPWQARPVLEVQDERGFLSPLPLSLADPPPDLAAILDGWGIRTLGALTALPKPEVGRRLGQAGIEPLGTRRRGDRPADRTLRARGDLRRRHGAGARGRNPGAAAFHPSAVCGPPRAATRQCQPRGSRTRARTPCWRTNRLPARLPAARAHREPRHPVPRAADPSGDAPHGSGHQGACAWRSPRRARSCGSTGCSTPGCAIRTALRKPWPAWKPWSAATGWAPRNWSRRTGPTHFFWESRPTSSARRHRRPILPPCGLPLRRFRPPVEAEVSIGLHGPAFVQSRIAGGDVARRRGPWRCSGGWWGPGCWAGEEWDVELARGGLFRLSLRAEQWWVEGMYD